MTTNHATKYNRHILDDMRRYVARANARIRYAKIRAERMTQVIFQERRSTRAIRRSINDAYMKGARDRERSRGYPSTQGITRRSTRRRTRGESSRTDARRHAMTRLQDRRTYSQARYRASRHVQDRNNRQCRTNTRTNTSFNVLDRDERSAIRSNRRTNRNGRNNRRRAPDAALLRMVHNSRQDLLALLGVPRRRRRRNYGGSFSDSRHPVNKTRLLGLISNRVYNRRYNNGKGRTGPVRLQDLKDNKFFHVRRRGRGNGRHGTGRSPRRKARARHTDGPTTGGDISATSTAVGKDRGDRRLNMLLVFDGLNIRRSRHRQRGQANGALGRAASRRRQRISHRHKGRTTRDNGRGGTGRRFLTASRVTRSQRRRQRRYTQNRRRHLNRTGPHVNNIRFGARNHRYEQGRKHIRLRHRSNYRRYYRRYSSKLTTFIGRFTIFNLYR